MDQTPKKCICCEFKCILLYPFTERVKIYGKNGIDLPQQIETAISENTTNFQSRGSQLLIGNYKCYKKTPAF